MDSPLKLSLHECLTTLAVGRRYEERANPNKPADFHTHVSMIAPKGRYAMDIRALEQFWDLYSRCVEVGMRDLGLAEKSQEYLPVLVDFDIKIPEDRVSGAIYTAATIDAVVREFSACLAELVDGAEPHELVCCVLEKPAAPCAVGDVKYIKNGFHLHYPYIFLRKEDHAVYVVPLMRERLSRMQDLFAHVGVADPSTLYDTQYYAVPWLMYGSHKPDGVPYKLSRVVDAAGSTVPLADAMRRYKIFSAAEQPIPIAGREHFYLPRILSIIPFHRRVHSVRPAIVSPVKTSMKRIAAAEHNQLSSAEISAALQRAATLLALVGEHRAASRDDWIRVGWALHNISSGSREGLDMWTDFSRRCPEKFCESVCIDMWSRMDSRAGALTIGTIAFFAKNDNPEAYARKIFTEKSMNDIKDTQMDIALRLYNMYSNEYACAARTRDTWYQYKNHRWLKTETGRELRLKISFEVCKTYQDELERFENLAIAAPDRYEKKMYEEKKRGIERLIKNLKSNPFITNVMRICTDLFYKDDFVELLDSDPFLFAFKNGVYDLRTNTLRSGIPEDYISTQSPLDYIEYSPTDPKVLEVYDCLRKIFPDRDVYDFFMDTTSEVFVGTNTRKLVLFWTGVGNNGKSVIQKFMDKILGPYCIKFPTSILTGKRSQSSSCTPELERAGKGVRWAVVQETDRTEQINVGMLKELSGNDEFYSRGLYAEGREIKPMFKLLVICNRQPRLPHIDQAIINRICVIPFESTFSIRAPADPEEQLRQKHFMADGTYIRDKVPELAPAFLWVLLHHRRMRGDTMQYPVPDKVLIATEKYIRRNDHYRQFTLETFVPSADAQLSVMEVYLMFKDWLRMSVPNAPIPTKQDVVDYYEVQTGWGEPSNGVWRGHAVRQTNTDYVPVDQSDHGGSPL